jgi:hypothetical protein
VSDLGRSKVRARRAVAWRGRDEELRNSHVPLLTIFAELLQVLRQFHHGPRLPEAVACAEILERRPTQVVPGRATRRGEVEVEGVDVGSVG